MASFSAPKPAPAPPMDTQTSPAPINTAARGLFTNSIAGPWVPLNRWCLSNGLQPPLRAVIGGTTLVTLRTPVGDFILRTGSQKGFWKGLEFGLGFAPQLINNQPFVHALDLTKTIQPLLNSAPEPPLPDSPVIVIDPGHGGADPGTHCLYGGQHEKEYVLDWALRLRALLATNGWQVWLTRTNDIDLPISNRVAFAEQKKANVFLSLHFNSSPDDQSQEGLETYCLTPAGMPSNLTRGYGDDLSAAFPNNAFDEQNLVLAARVHKALLQSGPTRDRGVRRARFLGVLRGQQRPAILVEGGYLSNPREARLIASSAHRQKLAEGIAQALLGREESKVQAMAPIRAGEVIRATNDLAQSATTGVGNSATNREARPASWSPEAVTR